MIGYYILSAILGLVGAFVSERLKSKFKEYAAVPLSSRLSGKEIAEKMLRDSGITDVQVISTPGFLSDHYNPENKTVNLSPDVYEGRSVSAAAVAAHECGHAVQHATSYNMLQMRSKMVPATKIGSGLSNILIMLGLSMAVGGSLLGKTVFLAGIVAFGISTLFTIVTLPVEYDASNRALAWLNHTGITRGEEHEQAKDALKWAARTYLVAAITSIASLLYFVMKFMSMGQRRD
jgi:uncharacterized protein